MFEIGACCKGRVAVERNAVFDRRFFADEFGAVVRAVALHGEWCEKAKQAIQFWVWASKNELDVHKDTRLLIAKLLWADRAAWSERRKY